MIMKTTVKYLLPLVCIFMLASCEKETKPYKGDAQVAFALKTYSINVNSATNSVTIPVQLIAKAPQGAITANINVDTDSTCASAVTVPTSVTIDAGRFTTDLVISVNHENLNAGNANRLILNLSSSSVHVAGNYNVVTITLNKQ